VEANTYCSVARACVSINIGLLDDYNPTGDKLHRLELRKKIYDVEEAESF
jgi:hypothetical protein